MDLRSILNASDSSEDDGANSYGGESSNIDLEQILREDDDEFDGGDGDHYYLDKTWEPKRIAQQRLRTSRTKAAAAEVSSTATTTPKTTRSSFLSNTNTHNPEEWAVLQHILNDDDDEDDDDEDDWMNTVESAYKKYSSSHVNHLIQSDNDDEAMAVGDTAKSSAPVTGPIAAVVPDHLAEQSVPSHKQAGSGRPTVKPALSNETDGNVPASTRNAARENKEKDCYSIPSSSFLQKNQTQEDRTTEEEEVTRKALAQAQATERKLLKAGHREIVSPLMVKRRLKPKIELSARFSQQRNVQNEQALSKAGPRFGFSGIVENKTLTGVSSSVVKHSDGNTAKVYCGLPTCLAFNTKFIVVGTQEGIILMYDLFEVLRQRLGTASFDDSHSARNAGSITSLDLSHNGEAVVAGYTSGMLVLWDAIRGFVLRTVTDIHQSAITSVRFLTELKMVTVDAGGLVNKLTFTRNMLWSNYSMETECLLDGTAGQILAMSVLSPYSTVKPMLRPEAFAAVLRNLTLIALTSERSSFAVAVDPKINVLHRWARPPENRTAPISDAADLPADQTYLPCLSWGWALVSGGGNVVMPILARAWGCCLQLLCSSFPTLDDGPVHVIGEEPVVHWPAFGVHNEVDATTPIVALEWLNERSLVFLTMSHEFTVVDTVMMTLLERLDFSGLRLVYAEFSLSRKASKEGTTGGESLAASSCTTFQNSTRCSDDRLMVLCQDELRCVSIVGARQRISALEADGEWLEALAFALDHYENTVVSQEDRRRDPNLRKDLSRHPEFSAAKSDDEEWIAKLLIRYLNLAVENAPDSSDDRHSPYSPASSTRIDLAQSHFQMLAGVCVEFCVVTRRLDLLFGPIFRRFQSVGFTAVFLDVLEPYVLNDKLSYIAPEVMSYFVEHCKATNGIATVERCLLHMDCTIMDFDSILSLLRSNEMYSALFYVFNQGLDDFVTPLEILLEKVFTAADAGGASSSRRGDGALRNDFDRLGYKAILYLQTCFKGKTFPQEKKFQPESRAQSAILELFTFLTQKSYSPSSHVKKAVNLLPEVGQRSLSFPYLRILLLVDPRGLLSTIASAIDSADSFLVRSRSASDSVDDWVDSGSSRPNQKSRAPDAQQITIDLASVLLPNSSTPALSQSTVLQQRGAVNAFLDFAAKYVMNGAVELDKMITCMILARVSNQYASTKDGESRQAFQRKVMSLLSALPRDSYDPDKVLDIFQKTNMHRAALLLHQQVASSWHEIGQDDIELRIRHFLSAIDCYIGDDDPLFKMNVFDYVKKECGGVSNNADSGDGIQPKTLRNSVFAKLPALVHLDALMTARLVAELFVDDLDEVIHSLESDDGEGLFLFLRAVISGDLVEADPVAGSVLNLSMEHHHKYLALMAKLHPEMVYDYLSTHDNYRSEECLRLCQEYNIADASAYLLERTGNVASALQLILQTLETRMMNLKRTIRGMGVDMIRQHTSRPFSRGRQNGSSSVMILPSKQEKDVDGVRRILIVALDVCERNSETISSTDEHDSSKFTHGELWFNVLDRLINAKGFLRLSKEQVEHANVMANVLSELLRLTMQRMVSSVPLTDLVRKVTSDHFGSRIGELREMVESLLATYGYELKVFSGAVTVFNHDIRCMRKEQLGLQLEGAPVRAVMNTDLESSGKAGQANKFLRDVPYREAVLRVSSHGNASIVENERISQSTRAAHGLVNAMGRLRARRGTGESGHGPSGRSADLNMMTVTERMYQNKETEPVVFGERLVGVLGEAEHRGRLMTFN